MRLYLVRHGQTASNVARLLDTAFPGAGLDEVGRRQADALVGRLDGRPIGAIYASDLVRTHQTAAPLAYDREHDLVIKGGLREIQAGDDEMSPDWQRYVEVLQSWRETPTNRVPNGEDAPAFYSRFDAAVAEIAGAGHGAALLVSHGAALRMWIMARVASLDLHDVVDLRLDNSTIVTFDGDPEAGLTFVAWDEPAPIAPADADVAAPGPKRVG